MKQLFKIHLFFYITSLIVLFSGHFKDYIYIMSIITIHEVGHILAGLFYHWNIGKIIVLPFGALTQFKIPINTPTKEEFFVTIMGPLFQIIGCTILYYISKNQLFLFYHYLLLGLNLIPIIPLDGSKLVGCLLYKLFPYVKGLEISIVVSYITIIVSFIYTIFHFNLLLVLWLIFLLIEVIKEQKNKEIKFYIFLKERYENRFSYPTCYVKGKYLSKIKKDYKTIFIENSHYYTEYELLKRHFSKG